MDIDMRGIFTVLFLGVSPINRLQDTYSVEVVYMCVNQIQIYK